MLSDQDMRDDISFQSNCEHFPRHGPDLFFGNFAPSFELKCACPSFSCSSIGAFLLTQVAEHGADRDANWLRNPCCVYIPGTGPIPAQQMILHVLMKA